MSAWYDNHAPAPEPMAEAARAADRTAGAATSVSPMTEADPQPPPGWQPLAAMAARVG
jgi:hypothetical protein